MVVVRTESYSKRAIKSTARCNSVQVTSHSNGRDAVVFSFEDTELGTSRVHLLLSVASLRYVRTWESRLTL